MLEIVRKPRICSCHFQKSKINEQKPNYQKNKEMVK